MARRKALPLQARDRGRGTTRVRTHCLHQRWADKDKKNSNPEEPHPTSPDAKPSGTTKKGKKRKRRGRNLPREIVESRLEPEAAERWCTCYSRPKAELGFETQERFFHQPARVTILDGLPIERVANQFRRFGVDLATSTLND
ncbi:MAG: hypothetical protein GY811_14340 [Myxococcales bacterium]|nr:hypothetical protein [Myxococcales bacterium]